MSDRVLIDAGPIVALFSPDDEHHARCIEALDSLTVPFSTCWPVIAEAAYLLRKRPDSIARMLAGFAGGFFFLLHLDVEDVPPIAAIMRRYEDIGLQLADATLAHLADREGIRTIFTLDRRDFSIIRLKRNRLLRLIPDVQ